MDFRVGDKVRFINYNEALEVYKNRTDIDFDVFSMYGNRVSKIIDVKTHTVILEMGFTCKKESIRKVDNHIRFRLDENLFKL